MALEMAPGMTLRSQRKCQTTLISKGKDVPLTSAEHYSKPSHKIPLTGLYFTTKHVPSIVKEASNASSIKA